MKRVLVVTHTTGYRHSSIETAERVLKELGESNDLYTVDYCRTAEDVQGMLIPEYLETYDGVFFANTSGDLGITDLPAFLKWIEEGHAFMGAHAASDTYKNEPAYVDMIGGSFKTHGEQCEVQLNVENADHPAIAHYPPSFRLYEEVYEHVKNDRTGKTVLLSMDVHPPDGHEEAGQPGDYLMAWTKTHGWGRVFYTALGHREDVWESQPFQAHLLGGIKWALGLV